MGSRKLAECTINGIKLLMEYRDVLRMLYNHCVRQTDRLTGARAYASDDRRLIQPLHFNTSTSTPVI